jgi:hypothetical protein
VAGRPHTAPVRHRGFRGRAAEPILAAIWRLHIGKEQMTRSWASDVAPLAILTAWVPVPWSEFRSNALGRYALQRHMVAVYVAHFLEVLEKFMGGRRSHYHDNPDLRLPAGVLSTLTMFLDLAALNCGRTLSVGPS